MKTILKIHINSFIKFGACAISNMKISWIYWSTDKINDILETFSIVEEDNHSSCVAAIKLNKVIPNNYSEALNLPEKQ